jgi:hypothetical protein
VVRDNGGIGIFVQHQLRAAYHRYLTGEHDHGQWKYGIQKQLRPYGGQLQQYSRELQLRLLQRLERLGVAGCAVQLVGDQHHDGHERREQPEEHRQDLRPLRQQRPGLRQLRRVVGWAGRKHDSRGPDGTDRVVV